MKKPLLTLFCLTAIMAAGIGLKAQQVTITLNPGWTWISYPRADTLEIATALGTFMPMEGDMIKSQYGFSTYSEGQWCGSVQQFYPGLGYKYYSTRYVPTTLVFGASGSQSQVFVTTSEPMLITAISAMGGGEVTVNDGTYIIVKGLCWAAHENPTTNDDFYQEEESGVGSFSISMTDLNIGATYYVRAYAVTLNGIVYGDQKTFTTRDGIPEVSTNSITDIQNGRATCRGTVTSDGGLAIIACGMCWSTSSSPTILDSHSTDGTGIGEYVYTMSGLSYNTTYFVRAYATNNFITVYGEELSFTTLNDDHAYVDLGLPSGLLWATCNVGADNPEDNGDYFAWGETQPKDTYNWSTYQYCNGSYNTLTKYCNKSNYGYNGFTDNLTTLLPEDDAATANWGAPWRMPTGSEWGELCNNTTVTWTTQNGVEGCLFTASNGNSLFLPMTERQGDNISGGCYWSNWIYMDRPNQAFYFYFFDEWDDRHQYPCFSVSEDSRSYGQSVRAVRSAGQNTAPMGAIDGTFTINSDGGYVYFSQGNLQYQASTNTWKFADNQWDCVGEANANISSTYDGWIDLFGWGTSGYNHGAVCYQPWSMSETNSDYYAYGQYTYNLNDQSGMADWGYNAISNGGNQPNQWRTLTKDEWDYVFHRRTTASGIRYARACVNNVWGVILLPDNWSSSFYNLSNINSMNGYNTITATQWTTLENVGAVFLPRAGYRSGTSVSNVGSYGRYWSASYNGNGANDIRFFNDILSISSNSRCSGLSVRLVATSEN